ncbi:hypothetical protein OOU_Y34scaffold00255g7 [Pyricularia oryzae Y34]|uniref:Uncharacterized protein n=1 Tax=Pyricularia oryzae (strain Y34) TaxID=1143189 RepID=A0AA97P4G1_PYRO3|nr:hypothetical protein OOU_Y34scaffold00255g7 [Pyricularia oryzae Y34]
MCLTLEPHTGKRLNMPTSSRVGEPLLNIGKFVLHLVRY